MKFLFILFFLSPLAAYANFEPFVPAWAKKCENQLTNKDMLYEVYHDCMDICMLKSPIHRKLVTKKRQRICTNFTARYFNRQVNVGVLEERLKRGNKFCGDQRIHRTGGHWLYISRQCKRLICDYNRVVATEKSPICRDVNQHLNNGIIREVYQPSTQSDINRRGTVPNTIVKDQEKQMKKSEVIQKATESPIVSDATEPVKEKAKP